MAVKFENPPLNEVAISKFFAPQTLNFRSEHFGLFWSTVQDEFPIAQQQPPIGSAFLTDQPDEIFPMPRYWLTSQDSTNLIQIQSNAFILNWKKADKEYPHFYEKIKPSFDRYFELFQNFVAKECDAEPLLDHCELNYTNVIEAGDFWNSPEDTQIVVPSFAPLLQGDDRFSNPSFNCSYGFDLDTDLKLNVSIRNAMSGKKQEINVLVFDIRAVSPSGTVEHEKSNDWFDRAHDTIIECFVKMTNPTIQREHWHPKAEIG